MSDDLTPLIANLIDWIGTTPRPYRDVMDAWRTSCPRLPVWEDAVEHGYVTRWHEEGRGEMVGVTQAGATFLDSWRARRPTGAVAESALAS